MERPITTLGSTTRLKVGCGSLFVTQSEAEGYKEIFLRLGKNGGCPCSFLDGVGRLISFLYNNGVSEDIVIKAFIGLRCPSPMWYGGKEHLSCLDAIAKLLKSNKKEQTEDCSK